MSSLTIFGIKMHAAEVDAQRHKHTQATLVDFDDFKHMLPRARETLELSSIAGWHYWRTSQRSVGHKTLPARPIDEGGTCKNCSCAFISCQLDYCNSLLCGLPDTLLRKLQSVQNAAAIISRRYYANSIGYTSEIASSSKRHAWFASRCPGKRLSTWPTAVSCPTALGALCS